MFKGKLNSNYSQQSVKGILICKNRDDKEDCKKLLQELGCKILLENNGNITIQASRARLKDLKTRHLATEDDKAQISSRLKNYFERILIGGVTR